MAAQRRLSRSHGQCITCNHSTSSCRETSRRRRPRCGSTWPLMDTWVQTTRQETRDLSKTVKGMKQLVEKLVRDTGSAEDLLQQYVRHDHASGRERHAAVRVCAHSRQQSTARRDTARPNPGVRRKRSAGPWRSCEPAEKQTQSLAG
ncbi:hypothetical protein PINS_up023399 [Pythium insidiosum]|nr:hypothetical protein PINS_up023399 [Pythium insidiosum]